MNRSIEFVGWAKSFMQDDFDYSVVVNFTWDGVEDIMIPAKKALDKKLKEKEYEDIYYYDITDWRWIK